MGEFDSSPLMKSALEVLCHSIEHFVARTDRDHRLAVLHLAQAVELASKGVLLEHNIPIYERSESRTLSWREAVKRLGELWGIDPAPQFARLELLVDERNSMQHRFGTVDALTMDYHMATVFAFVDNLMTREFAADLHAFIRENLDPEAWRKCRFVKDENQSRLERARALVSGGDPTAGLLEAFAVLEGEMFATTTMLEGRRPSSSLDVLMKYAALLSDSKLLPRADVQRVASAYRLRNSAVHGNEPPAAARVLETINVTEKLVTAMVDPATHGLLRQALDQSNDEHRGRGGPTEELADDELVRLVAERQLKAPPPRFVGLSLLGRQTNSMGRLQDLIDRDALIVYRVPNPDAPDYPTAAVRVNVDDPFATSILEPNLIDRLSGLRYPEQNVA